MEAELIQDVHTHEKGAMLDRGPGLWDSKAPRAASCLWGRNRVVASGLPNRRSRIWRATSLSAVVQNPQSIDTVSPWSTPTLGLMGGSTEGLFDFLTSS